MKRLIAVALLAGFACHLRSALAEQPPPKSREEALRRLILNDGDKKHKPPFFGEPFPSWDDAFPPPDSQKAKAFVLSQDYPSRYKTDERFPWESVDFKTLPDDYLRTVLNYCVKGMENLTEESFDVRTIKGESGGPRWFHAPWQHDDGAARKRKGREYLRGLTREKDVEPKGLHPLQTKKQQAWAVGYYNERGAYTLRRVWRTPSGYPDPAEAVFPTQTVTFKLLFTDATASEVPYLANSLEWIAHIPDKADTPSGQAETRIDRPMRLLQIDVAVKDPRVAGGTGWIFGTFIYDGGSAGATVWDRMTPVGLSWGDDVEIGFKPGWDNRTGAFINPQLRESLINRDLISRTEATAGNSAYVTHLGLGGRLNGPVDNAGSSCISCHGRAGVWHWSWEDGSLVLPESAAVATTAEFNENFGVMMPFLASNGNRFVTSGADFPAKDFVYWFRPIPPNGHLESALFTPRAPANSEPVTGVFMTTDYSLQIAGGIRNFYTPVRKNRDLVQHLKDIGLVKGSAFENATPAGPSRGDATDTEAAAASASPSDQKEKK